MKTTDGGGGSCRHEGWKRWGIHGGGGVWRREHTFEVLKSTGLQMRSMLGMTNGGSVADLLSMAAVA
jgi:hypothetical protein